MSHREDDELHSSPMFPEGRVLEGSFLGLLRELDVATEVFAEADLTDDNCAVFLVEGGRVWRGGVRDSLRVY